MVKFLDNFCDWFLALGDQGKKDLCSLMLGSWEIPTPSPAITLRLQDDPTRGEVLNTNVNRTSPLVGEVAISKALAGEGKVYA